MGFENTLDPRYYRDRVNGGEAAMREHSGDRMWHGTKYRVAEEEALQRRYGALNRAAKDSQQLWLSTLRASLLPLTADGVDATKCCYCQDTGVSTGGRYWMQCRHCGAFDMHAARIRAAAEDTKEEQ